MKPKCSIVEMKFFHDHLRKSFLMIKAENKKFEVRFSQSGFLAQDYQEYFKTLAQAFHDIGELAYDLNDHKLAKYVSDFTNVVMLAADFNHERTQKKVALMALERENLVGQLISCYDNPRKYEDVLRAYEVLSFKEERLLQSDLGIAPQEFLKSS